MKNNLTSFLVLIILLCTSCASDDSSPSFLGEFEGGYFVLNEGPFGSGSGSLSFINSSQSEISSSVFASVNATALGNILQSAYIQDSHIFLVVNNSSRIVVANRFTLQEEAVISEGLHNPRYMVVENNKGFVSNWGDASDPTDDYVAVINLQTMLVENTISVSEGPEKLLAHNGNVYVLHTGGWNINDKVLRINAQSEQVENEFTVASIPNSMALDGNMLYILCQGTPSWAGSETEGALYALNTSTQEIQEVSHLSNFSMNMDHASHLSLHNGSFYLDINGSVYHFSIGENAHEAELFLSESFYDFYWIENYFFGLDAADFNSNGSVKIYEESGLLQHTFTAGIIPTMVLKN